MPKLSELRLEGVRLDDDQILCRADEVDDRPQRRGLRAHLIVHVEANRDASEDTPEEQDERERPDERCPRRDDRGDRREGKELPATGKRRRRSVEDRRKREAARLRERPKRPRGLISQRFVIGKGVHASFKAAHLIRAERRLAFTGRRGQDGG